MKQPFALAIQPATPERWDDLVALFSRRGDQSSCWCMFWRIKRQEFHQQTGEQNKLALHDLVESGHVPGILGYLDGQPAGWCSIAPRQEFPVLDRSPALKRLDDQPVWSIVCFFIVHELRGRGLSQALLSAAVDYAKKNGAEIVEAYPIIPGAEKESESQRYTGVISTFLKAGFVEAARRPGRRVVMRYFIRKTP